VLHCLDVDRLQTLATVLVKYLGTRIVCQSMMPGILHHKKRHSLLYGAVEMLSILGYDKEMHELLENSIGEGCTVATHTIPAHSLMEERMDVIKKYRITPTLEKEREGDDDKDELIGASSATAAGEGAGEGGRPVRHTPARTGRRRDNRMGE